jgi:hypothetical protein
MWIDHIRPYLSSTPDAEVRRADDFVGQGVMEDIFQNIVTSSLVVAECTGLNGNVMYELGLAHSLGKRTALLAQNESDIPFDLRRFRFCIYADNSSGYPKLQKFLQQVATEVFGNI